MNTLLASREEELRSHLKNVAFECERLARRLWPGRFNREPYLAGLLHDIGKGLSFFQPMLKERGVAPCHEVFSFIIANPLLEKLTRSKEEKAVVVYAIVMHHQGMSSFRERAVEGVLNLRKQLKRVGWRSSSECELLSLLLEVFEGELDRLEVEGCFEGIVELVYGLLRNPTVGGRGLMRQVGEVERLLFDRVGLLCRARVLSGLVMVADTFVASRSRGGGVPTLYRGELCRLYSCLGLAV